MRIRALARADARPTPRARGTRTCRRRSSRTPQCVSQYTVFACDGHPGGVVADGGVEVVVVARGGVDRLRAADLLRRLAEEDERAREAVLLQRRLGGEHPAERSRPERRVGVGVAGRLLVHACARLPVRHGLLGVAGDGVVLGVGAEDGPAAARSSPGTRSACRRCPPRPRSRAREGAARSARPTGTRARPARGSPRSSVSSARASCGARRPTRAPCASARSDHRSVTVTVPAPSARLAGS